MESMIWHDLVSHSTSWIIVLYMTLVPPIGFSHHRQGPLVPCCVTKVHSHAGHLCKPNTLEILLPRLSKHPQIAVKNSKPSVIRVHLLRSSYKDPTFSFYIVWFLNKNHTQSSIHWIHFTGSTLFFPSSNFSWGKVVVVRTRNWVSDKLFSLVLCLRKGYRVKKEPQIYFSSWLCL